MCNLCPKYNTCNVLCDAVLEKLDIKDDDYSDSREVVLSSSDIDNILYCSSLSEAEYSRVNHLIIAILSPKQKKLLKLFSEGKSQVELANIFNVSQPSISQSMQAIKREISSQFKMIINV